MKYSQKVLSYCASLVTGLAALAVILCAVHPTQALAQSDPLPSWNDGPAKQAIVEFVQKTADKSSPTFVPQEERIATFLRHERRARLVRSLLYELNDRAPGRAHCHLRPGRHAVGRRWQCALP